MSFLDSSKKVLRTVKDNCPIRRRVWQSSERLRTWWVVAIFVCSIVVVGKWWGWMTGEVEFYIPVAWTLVISVLIWAVPEKRVVVSGVLVVWGAYSLKGVFIDREPHALYVTAIAGVLILILLLSFLITGPRDDGYWPSKK